LFNSSHVDPIPSLFGFSSSNQLLSEVSAPQSIELDGANWKTMLGLIDIPVMLVVPLLKVARSHQRPTQQFDAGAFLPNGQLFQSKDQIRSANKVSPFLCLPG